MRVASTHFICLVADPSIDDPVHVQIWESSRFRVYDVCTEESDHTLSYQCYGLLVALSEATLRAGDAAGDSGPETRLLAGQFLWIEPPLSLTLQHPFRGIFAQWR